MENFKNYLETQLNIIEIKLKGILVEIENIPDPSDIDLTIYGSKEQIKKEYNKKVKVSLFKKIIGPSMGDLKEYLRDREISRLSKLKLRYERQISQIKQAISYLYGNGTTEIYPNDEIIRFLFKYVSNHNINPSDVLRYLIDICETSLDRTNVEDKMKRNLTSFFDYEGNILKEAKISTIYLILDKLFASVFTEQELEEYNIIVNQLYVQIRLDKDKISKKDSKLELELKRKALIELQEHICGTSIIKTLDLKSFKLLLDTAGIDKQIQEMLLKKMEKKIKEEDLAFQRQKTLEAMNMFLSDEDIELIKQAEVKENTLIGPLNELVSRAKKDVISMCKYLSLFDPTSDVHDALEILNDRLRVLKHVLLNIDEEHKESNTLFYVTDKDGVPFILRNLELHQISEYNNEKCNLDEENRNYYMLKKQQAKEAAARKAATQAQHKAELAALKELEKARKSLTVPSANVEVSVDPIEPVDVQARVETELDIDLTSLEDLSAEAAVTPNVSEITLPQTELEVTPQVSDLNVPELNGQLNLAPVVQPIPELTTIEPPFGVAAEAGLAESRLAGVQQAHTSEADLIAFRQKSEEELSAKRLSSLDLLQDTFHNLYSLIPTEIKGPEGPIEVPTDAFEEFSLGLETAFSELQDLFDQEVSIKVNSQSLKSSFTEEASNASGQSTKSKLKVPKANRSSVEQLDADLARYAHKIKDLTAVLTESNSEVSIL